MEVLLDTNAFKNKELIKTLANTNKTDIKIYTSVIVALEHYFHLTLKQKTILWEQLKFILQLTVLPITENEARLAAHYSTYFLQHPKGPAFFFFDCLIAATAKIWDLTLITENIKDFKYLPEGMVLRPEDLIQIL